MYPVKQSTELIVPMYCHDANGDAVTGMSDGDFTKRISKGGGAFGAMTVTITELEGGWYYITLSTDHTNTLGILTLYFTHASCEQVNLQFRVSTRILDNLAFPTVSGRSTDTNTQGHVGLDFDETSGTLSKDTDLLGFNDLSSTAITALIALYAPSLALTAYAPLTTTHANALAASTALAAYNGPTHAEISAALTAVEAQMVAQAASTALTAYDGPTHTEMTAELAALENIAVADILAGVADGSLTVQDALKAIIAYTQGRIVKASTAFTYYSQTSVSLWVNNISATDRNVL